MMRERKGNLIPFALLALEFVGSVLMALGIAKQFGGVDLLPIVTQFNQSAWLLIGLGFMLTLPFLFYILAKLREKLEQDSIK